METYNNFLFIKKKVCSRLHLHRSGMGTSVEPAAYSLIPSALLPFQSLTTGGSKAKRRWRHHDNQGNLGTAAPNVFTVQFILPQASRCRGVSGKQ
jgi:hypothetical protein